MCNGCVTLLLESARCCAERCCCARVRPRRESPGRATTSETRLNMSIMSSQEASREKAKTGGSICYRSRNPASGGLIGAFRWEETRIGLYARLHALTTPLTGVAMAPASSVPRARFSRFRLGDRKVRGSRGELGEPDEGERGG